MSETIEYCDVCETIGTLVRMPSMFYNAKEALEQKSTAASRVKDFIEDAKDELEEQKKILTRGKND